MANLAYIYNVSISLLVFVPTSISSPVPLRKSDFGPENTFNTSHADHIIYKNR